MNKINDTFLRFSVCAQEPREVEQAFLGSIRTNHTRSGRRVWGFYLSSEQVLLTGCCLALGCLRLFDSSWGSFEKRRAHTSCLEWQVWLSSAFTEAPERDRHLHPCTSPWCHKGTELEDGTAALQNIHSLGRACATGSGSCLSTRNSKSSIKSVCINTSFICLKIHVWEGLTSCTVSLTIV